jgi:hypothetical protein
MFRGSKVDKKKAKLKEIAEKYDPEIAYLEAQKAKSQAEVTRERERIQKMIDAGRKPSAIEIQGLKSIETGIRTRDLKIRQIRNEKRMEELAVDLDVDVEKINEELEDIADEMELSMEDEMDRSQALSVFEQRVAARLDASMSIEMDVAGTQTEDLAALGFDVSGIEGDKGKSTSEEKTKEKESSREEEERESLFE